MEGACYRHNPIDCGDLNSAGVTAAAAASVVMTAHSFQQRCHAACAVIAVSLSGTCAYRRKVCLTSDSCCRAPHSAVCGPTKMSCSNIRHAGRAVLAAKERNDRTAGRSSCCWHYSALTVGLLWRRPGSVVVSTAVSELLFPAQMRSYTAVVPQQQSSRVPSPHAPHTQPHSPTQAFQAPRSAVSAVALSLSRAGV